YLERVAAVRDGEIEAWLADARDKGTAFTGDDPEAAVQRSRKRAASQRRLVERLGVLETNVWNEVADALSLDAAQLALLQARGTRERALDLRIRQSFGGGSEPVDLAEILARLEADAEESAAIRAALADHDQRLTEALRGAMDEQLDLPVKFAESLAARQAASAELQAQMAAEAEAAAAEGRPAMAIEATGAMFEGDPLVDYITGDRAARSIALQQAESLARLQGLVADERLNALLVGVRLAPGDGMSTFFRNSIEPRIKSGAISTEQAAEVEAIRADHFRERVAMAFEYAREDARTEPMMAMSVDGSGDLQPPAERRVDVLRRELTSTLPDRTRERLASILDMDSIAGGGAMLGRTGRGRRAGGEIASFEIGEAVEGQAITFTAVSLVATLDGAEDGAMPAFSGPISISFAGEGGMAVLGGRPAAPPLRAMDQRRFATMLADADADAALRDIAEQIRRDTAESFDEIVRDLEAQLEAAAERRRQADQPSPAVFVLGRGEADLPTVDAAVRRCLEADRIMFDSLEAVLGEQSAETLAMWRDARAIELLSIAAGLRENAGRQFGFVFSPWQGKHAAIDLLELAIGSVPQAMRDPGVRAAAARELLAQRQAVETYWSEQQSIRPELKAARDAVFNRPPPVPGAVIDPVVANEEGLARHRELAKAEARREESDRRVREAMKSSLARLEQAMPPEASRSFHAEVRRAAWPDVVPSMPALDGMNAAMRIVAADEVAMGRLAEIEEAYLAESEALFEGLDGLALPTARRDASNEGPGGFSPEQMQRWESISGRLRFRHRELDYETVLALRALVGPEQASRIEWPRGSGARGPTFSFIGG
ncbi:MAG: hypothetical protein ACO396_09380, partial [Phycisphaerales bacterium]